MVIFGNRETKMVKVQNSIVTVVGLQSVCPHESIYDVFIILTPTSCPKLLTKTLPQSLKCGSSKGEALMYGDLDLPCDFV